eukprot:scaffold236117_cov28-Tisochrysis_lutea.AAC.3
MLAGSDKGVGAAEGAAVSLIPAVLGALAHLWGGIQREYCPRADRCPEIRPMKAWEAHSSGVRGAVARHARCSESH